MLRILALPVAMLAENNRFKVTYHGGSLPDTKAAKSLKVYIEANQIRFIKDQTDLIVSPQAFRCEF